MNKLYDYELRINGGKLGDFETLADVWRAIDDRYQALPDQYSDSLTWVIEHWKIIDGVERLRTASKRMEAGLWYAYAEDAEAFRQWLNMFGWKWAASQPPPSTPNPPHSAVS